MSPWYQETPNGAFGSWITKKSKSVFGGKPLTVTSITSTGPTELIETDPLAFGRQPAAAVDGTIENVAVEAANPVEAVGSRLLSASATNPTTSSLGNRRT